MLSLSLTPQSAAHFTFGTSPGRTWDDNVRQHKEDAFDSNPTALLRSRFRVHRPFETPSRFTLTSVPLQRGQNPPMDAPLASIRKHKRSSRSYDLEVSSLARRRSVC
ncbi:MAG: hypothetical protein ACTS53_01960 [Candidatus Hodgkinia cicadicola]